LGWANLVKLLLKVQSGSLILEELQSFFNIVKLLLAIYNFPHRPIHMAGQIIDFILKILNPIILVAITSRRSIIVVPFRQEVVDSIGALCHQLRRLVKAFIQISESIVLAQLAKGENSLGAERMLQWLICR
jgi:hypothetical protein